MVSLKGYQIGEGIHTNHQWIITNGTRLADMLPVLIKVPAEDNPDQNDIRIIRHDYEIGRLLNHDNILRYLELVPCTKGFATIADEFVAESLESFIRRQLAGIDSFLRIAIQLTRAIDCIHRHQIIHCDLNPTAVLINPLTLEVKMADFSLASRLNKIVDFGSSPADLTGALPFISPEQTGRINRVIDFRTDFYSLGVTLYYLLTGRLPFEVTDPAKLIHAHIAQYPIFPCELNSEIPVVLSDIVMKLMSKNMEDRYQTAAGLLADLEICYLRYKNFQEIPSFEIGKNDLSPRLHLSHKFYSRDCDLDEIVGVFDRIDREGKQLLMISGNSGAGKSFLLKEIGNALSLKRARIITGNYEPTNSGNPFQGLIQAFRQAIRTILTESDQKLEEWKKRFVSGLGENIKIIGDVIPELESITGSCTNAPNLESAEIQNRFAYVLVEFVKLLCQPATPLVLILENLNSAEAASIKLLESILIDPEIVHFFCIMSYSTEPGDENQAVQQLIDSLTGENQQIKQIRLENLTLKHVAEFINDSFACGTERANTLAAIVTPKTGGNLHFLKLFLLKLYHSNQIRLQTSKEGGQEWFFDFRGIATEFATDNVIDFLIAKLNRLDITHKNVLATAACLGLEFKPGILAVILDQDEKELFEILMPAVDEGIITAIDPGSRKHTMVYRFVHSRLQQAAYQFLTHPERQKTHYRIGHFLQSDHLSKLTAERLFQVVNHLNQGWDYIHTAEEWLKLMRLNLEAGIRAKQSNAFEAAIDYFQTGIRIFSGKTIPDSDRLIFSLNYELADALYMTGEFDRMEQIVLALINTELPQSERVKICGLRIKAYMAHNRMSEALAFGLNSLKQIGFTLPAKPGKYRLLYEMMKTRIALSGKSVEELKMLPRVNVSSRLLVLNLIRKLLMPAFVVNPRLFVHIILKMTRLTIKWGNSEECIFYTYYGLILCGIYKDFGNGYRFGHLGVQMIEQFPNCKNRASNIHIFEALIRIWKEPLRNSLAGMLEGYKLGIETGNMEIAVNSLYSYGLVGLYAGDTLVDVEKRMEEQFQKIRRHKHQAAIYIGSVHRQTIINLLGKSSDPCNLNNPYFQEDEVVAWYYKHNDQNGLVHYYCDKIFLNFLFGNYQQVIAATRRFKPLMAQSVSFIFHVLINFYYALSILAVFPSLPDNQGKHLLREIESWLELLNKMADSSSFNFLNKLYLVKAELSRVKKTGEEQEFYRKAIDLAGENGLTHEQAIANELFGNYWLNRNEPKIAELFHSAAHSLYERWGAAAKIKHLESKFPGLVRSDPAKTKPDISATFQPSKLKPSQQFDFQAILEAIRIVSGEVLTNQLLSRILTIIIEHSGAGTGLLIRKQNAELVVVAGDNPGIQKASSHNKPSSEIAEDTFCRAIVSFVLRSGEDTVLENAYLHSPFANDPYIRDKKVRSLLCTPFRIRDETYGVLYLENNLADAVFTNDRVIFIRTLLAQASVSMETARLYERTVSTQKELIKSEEKYKTLVEHTGAMVIHLSLGGIVLFINASGAQFFNAEPTSLIGKSVYDLSGFFESIFKERVLTIVTTGKGVVFEEFISLAKGDFWFITNYQPVKDEQGQTIAVQMTAQDISEYKAAEEELKRLSTILEATSDFVSICLPDMNVQYLNSAGKKMIGLDDDVKSINLEFKDFHPRWAMRIINAEGIPGAINNGIWSGETALLHTNGSEIPTSQVIMAHRSANGSLQFISTIARDISRQKRTEQELKQYQEQLESLIAERTSELKVVQGQLVEKAAKAGIAEIAAGTLHNVGNLLNSIKTSANTIDNVVEHSSLPGFLKANELLQQNMDSLVEFMEKGAKGEKLMQYYLKLGEALSTEHRSIKNDIRRLNDKIDIITDVITAQQSYAGVDSTLEENSLITIIEDALILEAGLIDRYGITVVKHYAEIPPVRIQKTKLIHVLINLINNARDAMLHLPNEERILTFTLTTEGDHVFFITKDTGKGITEDHMSKIFSHGFTTKKGGHGFGLHSSANFIREMNGNLWVESEGEGKGASFVIQLPIVISKLPV